MNKPLKKKTLATLKSKKVIPMRTTFVCNKMRWAQTQDYSDSDKGHFERREMQQEQCKCTGEQPLRHQQHLNHCDRNEEPAHKTKFSEFCDSNRPSEDTTGNKIYLSTQRKTHVSVKPQLQELDNPMDPKLKCTTCDKKINSSCGFYHCRPCQMVRICDNNDCAILHHCKIRKPKAFCTVCRNNAMFLCKRCQNKPYCSNQCQKKDWKRHKKDECKPPYID